MNFRISIAVVSSIVFTMLAGCQPSKVSEEAGTGCVPKNLTVETGNESMTVIWKPDCKQLISGYYVYISEEPLYDSYGNSALPQSIEPFNNAAFAGDTEPQDGIEHFEATGLENGKRYYVSVRTIFPNRTLSHSSNEQVAVCGPRGEIELAIRYKGDNDGYSFGQDKEVRADDLANDIYFHSLSGKDYLGSPEKLDGFLRKNRLTVLPFKGEFDEVRQKAEAAQIEPDQDRVEIKKNDWILVNTEDNQLCLINVLGFSGDGENRVVSLFFAYSTIPGQLLF